MHKHLSVLKLASYAVAGIGMLLGAELQRRETKVLVEEVLSEREAKLELPEK